MTQGLFPLSHVKFTEGAQQAYSVMACNPKRELGAQRPVSPGPDLPALAMSVPGQTTVMAKPICFCGSIAIFGEIAGTETFPSTILILLLYLCLAFRL